MTIEEYKAQTFAENPLIGGWGASPFLSFLLLALLLKENKNDADSNDNRAE